MKNTYIHAWKFNKGTKCSLEDLSDSIVCRIKAKIENGIKPTLEELMWLTENANHSCLGKGFVTLMGWAFDFSDYLKRYVYHQYGHWYEMYAPNKTILRKSVIAGSKVRVVEVK